jgi:hypothetical protein
VAVKVRPFATPACPPQRVEGAAPCAVTGVEGKKLLLFPGMSMEAEGPLIAKLCETPEGHLTDTFSTGPLTDTVFDMELGSAMEA